MPRIMGVNLLAALAGAVAMYFIGFLIYGLIFQEVWSQQTLVNHGLLAPDEAGSLTGETLTRRMQDIPSSLSPTVAMSFGFVISLVTALGIAVMLSLTKPMSLGSALLHAAILWVGFAATTLAYNVVYSSESMTIFHIDLAHLLLGYLAAAAAIFLIDGKAIRGES